MSLDIRGGCERLVATTKAIAPKIGCGRNSLRRWVQQEETGAGRRDGVRSEQRARIKEPEREFGAFRQANEILQKASAHFARAQLDRSLKR